ncbi:MAG: lipid IV(A) 3-deoxy-D-manno-octulosonic acid transferase [Gammaproteobacteria bacterium]|nr:lipid IV(A) 3-deoxy-D-manno-octulosonic acid transferase [Gammaproteobacteria bacterium]
MRQLYSALHYLALPYIFLRLLWRGQRDPGYLDRWGERFGRISALDGDRPTLWVHAVSVGEVQAAVPLVRALRAEDRDVRIVVTTTTPTGRERVRQALGNSVLHRYAPYDLPGAVRRFLERVRPRLVIIMETELWPNILHQCARRRVPVLLANARLSEQSAASYRRIASTARRMLSSIACIAAQTRHDAERFIALGARPDCVRVTGNTKFDVRLPASLNEEAQVLRRCFGVDRGVWIAASTHDGEEQQVLEAYRRVLATLPDSLLVLVPRHPDRAQAVAALARKLGYAVVMRSENPTSCAEVGIFIGDSMGELPLFYAASDVAFVGGSLVPEGGHNMLEPAALGIPIVFGPHVHDVAEISERLEEVAAGTRVENSEELAATVLRYMGDANLRHVAGQRGREFVQQNRGALNLVMELVDALMAPAEAVESLS